MQLASYQDRSLEELYTRLVNEEQRIIAFTGPKGCGKSAIIEELIDSLKENWKVFLITGAYEESPPYFTWYSAYHKKLSSTKFKISEISFGVNFEPLGLPVALEVGVGIASGETVFNNNEQAILKSIFHEANGMDNILLVAEDYSLWDAASKSFLLKMVSIDPSSFGKGRNIHTILVDSSLEKIIIPNGCDAINVSIKDISLSDIEKIVRQLPHIKALQLPDLEKILQFTGYDLRLISLAVSYQQESLEISTIQSLEELLEKRILNMPKEQQEVFRTLEHVSIINTLFSEKEAAYLLKKEPLHIEKILDEAVNLRLIRKRQAYDFANPQIQKYFEDKLYAEKKYLHYHFAEYLRLHFPEDYSNRAYHLFLSKEACSEHNIMEAAYLLAIEIVRRKELAGDIQEAIFEEKLEEMINSLAESINHMVRSNIVNFMDGYALFTQCNYSHAVNIFGSLQWSYASQSFFVEAKRLLLLCQVQMADDLHAMKRLADELYDCISSPNFNEDELWCRTALLLLEVYGDRYVQTTKFELLKSGFDQRIRKHMHKSVFRALYAKHACKSILFENAVIAVKLTEESCEYYRTYNSIYNLYLSLCNNAANRLVCGEYLEAEKRLIECQEIILQHPHVHFPSTYKIDNNIIINTFLQSEGDLFNYHSKNKALILSAAYEAALQLELLKNRQGDEVSHVIEFNLLSMLMLIGNRDRASSMLKKLKREYKYLDPFYKYYYHNAWFSWNLLDGNFTEAENHLDTLEELEVVLLSGYNKILHRRNQILHQLVEEQFEGDAFSYNYEFVKKNIHVQDPSASFWGRGFLLSDLQFLSI